MFALEYGTTVLALELSHQRSLAEVDRRIATWLTTSSGLGGESAYAAPTQMGTTFMPPLRRRDPVARPAGGDNRRSRRPGHQGASAELTRIATLRIPVVLLVPGSPGRRDAVPHACRRTRRQERSGSRTR